MQVPLIRTIVSTKEYAHAGIVAWRFLYGGKLPTKEAIGVLFAQWIVETGGKACWNWNLGNVKATQVQVDANIPWIDLPGTFEYVHGVRVQLKEGDPGRRFRAYASLDAGMAEYMAFLRNKHYAPSWPRVEAGDPDGFARALKAQGYYTGSEDDYARIMRGAHKAWMSSSAFDDALRDVIDSSERETEPEIVVNDMAIVHPLVPLESPTLDESEPPPPDDAA